MNLAILIIIVACGAACWFAACQIALKTFSRKRLTDLLEERHALQRMGLINLHGPRLLLLTGLGRTCLSLVVALTSYDLIHRWLLPGTITSWGVYTLAFLLAAGLVSVFAVALPVSWARYRRERLLVWSLPVLRVLMTLTFPVTWTLHLLDPIVRRVSGVDLLDEEHEIGEEVIAAVEEHEAGFVVDQQQKDMLEAVFDLSETAAGEIMTPRTDVHGIEASSDLSAVQRLLLDYGHSRIPVYEEDMDHILGLLYAKDMIRFIGDGRDFDLRAVLREAHLVPESKSVRDLLAEMKSNKVHIAIVIDEYGGTAGVVTIEDILEEIVGEIQDEYEHLEVPPSIDIHDEGHAEADARVHIDDLNDTLDLEVPEDEDYDTLGGFVVATLGRIPVEGDAFEVDGIRYVVTEAERTKVKRVRIEKQGAGVGAERG